MSYDIPMSLNQIGMLLEIVGFVLVAVLVGVFLEGNVLGTWGSKAEALLSRLSSVINELPSGTLRWWLRESLPSGVKVLSSVTVGMLSDIWYSMFLASISMAGVILVVCGWLASVLWWLWLGAGLLCVFVTWIAVNSWGFGRTIDHLLDSDKPPLTWQTFRDVMKIAIFAFLFCVIVIPVFSPLTLLDGLFITIVKSTHQVTQFLATRDTLKKVLVMSGTLLVVVGLVLQFIAAI